MNSMRECESLKVTVCNDFVDERTEIKPKSYVKLTYAVYNLTENGFGLRRFKSLFSPNRYASGCGVSNLDPPMRK